MGALIKEPLLSDHRILNVHPSLLPRGAAPLRSSGQSWPATNAPELSIIILTEGLDSGPVCRQSELEIAPEDDDGTLAERLQQLGGEDLVAVLDEDPEAVPQPEDGVTYADKITPEDRHLHPERESAAALARRIRALTPHIGAYLELPDGAGRLGVSRARALDPAAALDDEIDLTGPRPRVRCAEGVLELLAVQPPGRRSMSAEEYLRGLRP